MEYESSSNQDYPTPEPSSPPAPVSPPVESSHSGVEESLGFEPEDVSSAHRGLRTRIDGAFIQFLIDYAANDPECPPLFKAFLEEVVLKPGTPDLRLKVEMHLRNPRIKDYGLGPNFIREFKKYHVYRQAFSEREEQDRLPYLPIPEQYQPRSPPASGRITETALQSPEVLDMIMGDDLGGDTGLSEEDSEAVDFGEGLERAVSRMPPLERPPRQAPRVPPDLRGPPRVSVPPIRSRNAGGRGRGTRKLGRLADLLQRLQSIPLFPGTSDFQDGNPIVEGPDWEVDSWYKGKRQPPLAARLDTVIKFLAEEDVDRCMGWEPKFEEIVSYLEWLALEDDSSQLDYARLETQAMFNDAVAKAKAHVLFEQHHYNPTTIEFTKPSKTPFRSTRLDWMVNAQDWPLPSHNPVPTRRNFLPKPILPHTDGPVNRMLIDRPESSRLHGKLAEDERDWWQRIADHRLTTIPSGPEGTLEEDNLAYHEDQAFITFSHPSSIHPVITDATGTTILPNDQRVRPGAPVDYAQERGARRAMLQRILRALPTSPPTTLHAHSSIIFPTPAATLRRAATVAENPAWTPPTLPASQLPPSTELETMPHTIAYRARLAALKKRRELARLRLEDEHANDTRWATLPRNVVSGGPFVWRMLDPDAQAAEDLLRECRVAVEVLRAAGRREPRGLVERVLGMVERGLRGEFVEWEVPRQEVRLAEEEWEVVDGERVPRYLNPGEVEWLKFLGGECVNGGNFTGRVLPDTPRDKYRLFQLFAKKVKKLLDDRNPQGLFSSHDATVEVEDLLKAINAGKNSSAVRKHEFKPHDACKWLDRMKDRGYLRFYLDPVCYGVVRRPTYDYFPEHRVIWPKPTDNRQRPSYHLGYIADWDTVINQGGQLDINEGSTIWNFFLALAFRLGYTISMLEQDHQHHPPQPIPAQNLRDSIRAWSRTCARLERSAATTSPAATTTPGTTTPGTTTTTTAPTTATEPTPRELAELRTQLIDELHLNKTMLAPGRAQHYFDASGTPQTVLVRDHNWDWAAVPKVGEESHSPSQGKGKGKGKQEKGKRRRQFWSINRWPVEDDGAGYLTHEAKRAVRGDVFADPGVEYDAAAVDRTTEWRYLRPKLQRYRQEKVVFRQGPAVYPVGDTRLQREVVRERMLEMVERAVGLDDEEPTWIETLAAGLNPFSRPSSRIDDLEEGKLPSVKPEAIPRSWDPVAEAERRAAAETEPDYEAEEDMEEEDEVESVDVPMTGMGESWMSV